MKYIVLLHECTSCGGRQEVRVPEGVNADAYKPTVCGACNGRQWIERTRRAA